jgi:hypothetical protein
MGRDEDVFENFNPNPPVKKKDQYYYYLMGPIRFYAPNDASSPLRINHIFWQGFGDNVFLKHVFKVKVHYGCPHGFYEDGVENATWSTDTPSENVQPQELPTEGQPYYAYCKKCPIGTYNDQVGIVGTVNCKECVKGKYGSGDQDQGSASYCKDCEKGKYGDTSKQDGPDTCKECLAGFYCPDPADNNGTLNTYKTGGDNEISKLEIQAGYYGGKEQNSPQGTGPCKAGYYCPKGSGDTVCSTQILSDQPGPFDENGLSDENRCYHQCYDNPDCHTSHQNGSKCFCPSGSSLSEVVPAGSYADGSSSKETRTHIKQCPLYEYCMGGDADGPEYDGWHHECPAGRYGRVEHADAGCADGNALGSLCVYCGPCMAGYYCPKGSKSKKGATDPDDEDGLPCGGANVFCKEGSTEPTLVSLNHMSICNISSPNANSDQQPFCPAATREKQTPCPGNSVCIEGVRHSIHWEMLGGEKTICASGEEGQDAEGEDAEGVGHVYEKTNYDTLVALKNGESTYTVAAGYLYAVFNNSLLPNASFSIEGEKCVKGAASSSPPDFQLNGRSLETKGEISIADCQQYEIDVKTVKVVNMPDGNQTNISATCTVTVDVKNVNDAPTWEIDGIKDARGIEEFAETGERVHYSLKKENNGKWALDAQIKDAMASDPDEGQDILYSIVASSPAIFSGTFGISQCSGDIYVQSPDLLRSGAGTQQNLCIKVCDDPSYFGNKPGKKFESICANATQYNTNVTCGTNASFTAECKALNGLCLPIYVIEVNRRPVFSKTPKYCVGPSHRCRVDELSNLNTVPNLHTGGEANISRLASDPDGDPLKWSAKCMSCLPVAVSTISQPIQAQGSNPPIKPKVTTTTNHNFKDNDRVIFTGVTGLTEVNSGQASSKRFPPFFNITRTGDNEFELKDVKAFESLNLGEGGEVRLAPFSVQNGIFKTNLPSDRYHFLGTNMYNIKVTVTDGDLVAAKTFQIALNDVNEAPSFPSGITLEIKENLEGPTNLAGPGSFRATDKENATGLTYESRTANFKTTRVLGGQTNYYTVYVTKTGGLNYEEENSVTVLIRVNDSGIVHSNCISPGCSDPLSADGTITVKVMDVNEPPTALSNVQINVSETTVIGTELALDFDTPFDYTDPEGDSGRFRFDLAHVDDQACFTIDKNTGLVKLDGHLDVLSDHSPSSLSKLCKKDQLSVKIVIDDNGKSAGPAINCSFVVNVSDEDEPPFFNVSHGFSKTTKGEKTVNGIKENSAALTTLLDMSSGKGAKDPEGTEITYRFDYPAMDTAMEYYQSDGTTPLFVISPDGIVKLNSGGTLDYEKKNIYSLDVNAFDAGNKSAETTVVLKVEDVNDAPTLSSTTEEADETSWLQVSEHLSEFACGQQPLSPTCASAPGAVAEKSSPTFVQADEDKVGNNKTYIFEILNWEKKNGINWENDTLRTFVASSIEGKISVNDTLSQEQIQASGLQAIGTKYRLGIRTRNDKAIPDNVVSDTVYVYIRTINSTTVVPIFNELFHRVDMDENITGNKVLVTSIECSSKKSGISFSTKISSPTDNLFFNVHTNGNTFPGEMPPAQLETFFNMEDLVETDQGGGNYRATGKLRVKSSQGLDFERGGFFGDWTTPPAVNISILCAVGESISKAAIVEVIVQDVNEAPFWKSEQYTISVWESSIGKSHGVRDYQNQLSFLALDVDKDDKDDGSSVEKWGTTKGNAPPCLTKCNYTIDSVIAYKGSSTVGNHPKSLYSLQEQQTFYNISAPAYNFEAMDRVVLKVKVWSRSSPSASADVTITILDRNEPPSMDLLPQIALNEGTATGTLVLDVLEKTLDPDALKAYTFSKPSEFCVYTTANVSTSVFKIKDNEHLVTNDDIDYENCTKYSVSILVNDGGNCGQNTCQGVEAALEYEAMFTIEIKDINDIGRPIFEQQQKFNTAGNESIVLEGINYGPTRFKIAMDGLLAATPVIVEYATCINDTSYNTKFPNYVIYNCDVDPTGNTKITCKTKPGVGEKLCWRVSYSNATGPFSELKTAYSPPSITEVPLDNFIPTGEPIQITILGNNFGNGAVKPVVRYKNNRGETYHAVGCHLAINHKNITCDSVVGAGKELEWVVSVASLESEPLIGSSYKASTVTTISPASDLKGEGGEAITITGEDFGPNGTIVSVEYSNSDFSFFATDCVVSDHTKIQCTSKSGVGRELKVQVTVSGLLGELSSTTLSYEAPVITEVTGPGMTNPSPTDGGVIIELKGINFGPPLPFDCNTASPTASPSKPTVHYGNGYEGQCCKVLSNTLAECLTGPGVGKGHSWTITIGGQSSDESSHTSSYAQPVIREYRKVKVEIDEFNTEGGEFIILGGSNFGPVVGNVDSISYGKETILEYQLNVTSACHMLTPHTEIKCKLRPGAGKELKWKLYVGGQENVSPTTSYGPPELESIEPDAERKELTQMGNQTVVLKGKNFGPMGTPGPYLGKVSYGVAGNFYDVTEDCEVTKDSVEITCRTSPGIGGQDEEGVGHLWYIEVRGQRSAKNNDVKATTSYAKPKLISLTPKSGPTHGFEQSQGSQTHIKITLSGINMGFYSKAGAPNTVEILFDDFSVEQNYKILAPDLPRTAPVGKNSTFGGIEKLTFNMPVGFGKARRVRVRINSADNNDEVYGGQELYFDYNDPVIYNVRLETFENAKCKGDCSGEDCCQKRLKIEGNNFCESAAVEPVTNNKGCGKLHVNGVDVFKDPDALVQYGHKSIQANIYDNNGYVNVSVGKESKGRAWSNTLPFDTLAPIIISDNATNLRKLKFTTKSYDDEYFVEDEPDPRNSLIWIAGDRFDQDPSKLCVSVGMCLQPPGPGKCVYNAECKTDEKVTGHFSNVLSVLKNADGNIVMVVFRMPAGAGLHQPLHVWKGSQKSSTEGEDTGGVKAEIDFLPPTLNANYVVDGKQVMRVNHTGEVASSVSTFGGREGEDSNLNYVIEGENFGTENFGNITVKIDSQNDYRKGESRTFDDLNLVEEKRIVSWSDEKIIFKMPDGQGPGILLKLFVNEQSPEGRGISLSYSKPNIHSVTPKSGSTTGGALLDIRGDNFGCSLTENNELLTGTFCGGGQEVRLVPNTNKFPEEQYGILNSYNCASPNVLDHKHIQCTVAPGEGKLMSALVEASSLQSDLHEDAFTYSRAVIYSLTPNKTSPTSGRHPETGDYLTYTIAGDNFGPPTLSTAYLELRCVNSSKFCEPDSSIRINKTKEWSKSHTEATFRIPEGVGHNLHLVIVVAGVPSEGAPFSYGAPSIMSVSPATGPTDGCDAQDWENLHTWKGRVYSASAQERNDNPDVFARRCTNWKMITLQGINFGPAKHILKVWVGKCSLFQSEETCSLVDSDKCSWKNEKCINSRWDSRGPFLAFDGSLAAKKDHLTCQDAQTRYHECLCKSVFAHDTITICAPLGFGRNLTVTVSVYGRDSTEHVPWDYQPPEIQQVNPRPYNAQADTLEVRGTNFGGVPSQATLSMFGTSCSDAQWHQYHPMDGLPYVTCTTPETVVGAKNMSLAVALQESTTIPILEMMDSSLIYAICKIGGVLNNGKQQVYWGEEGDLCALCPQGARCVPNTALRPSSSSGFWREPLDITEGQGQPVDDIMGLKAKDDFKRAQQRCPKSRLLTSPTITKQFPSLTQKEQCFDFIACIPKEACKGNNSCAPEYLHEKDKCTDWEERNNAGKTSCTSDLQCRVRSGGEACVAAVQSICQCEAQWLPRSKSLSCLKACLRDSQKSAGLVSACSKVGGRLGSTLENMYNVMARVECGAGNPEDCASCAPQGNSSSGEFYGECSCTPGYRCAMCTSGTHHRIDNKCEECPSNPILFLVLILLGLIALCVMVYQLDRQEFNLAFINIGWDYFQVLSMFSDADVDWPPTLKSLYRVLSVFSFDIDVVAPECLIPGFPYVTKFYMAIYSPIICCGILMFTWLCTLTYEHVIRGTPWRNRDKFLGSRYTATFLLMLYFLYVTVTRQALEIFNCNPLPGAYDGYLYTEFTSFDCDSGPCRCDDPRHIQMQLKTPALVAIVGMTFGFPAGMLILLRSKKLLIKEDQLLRAAGIGNTVETSSNFAVYQIRVALHKMYYHFLPGKSFWIIFIIARKGAIAAAALIFRANPGFQLSTVVLVLFIAYVLQVKHKPYMSTSQRQEALANHALKAKEGDPEHVRIHERIKNARSYVAGKRKNSIRRGKGDVKFGRYGLADGKGKHFGYRKKEQRHYFWDYNTVEQVLLASAILVALAGVMFESDRFENDKSGAYAWQRDLITYLILVVVFFSLTYYMIVFVFEIYGKTPEVIARMWGAARFRNRKSTETDPDLENNMFELTLVHNPLLAADSATAEKRKEKNRKKLADMKAVVAQNEEQNKLLMLRLRQAKQQGNTTSLTVAAPQRPRKKSARRKKEFGQLKSGTLPKSTI